MTSSAVRASGDTGSTAPSVHTSGPITWSYVGPQDSLSIESVAERMAARDKAALRTEYGDFSEAARVDRNGDLWIVEGVDWPAYVAKESAYTAAAGQAPTAHGDHGGPFEDTDDSSGSYDLLNWTDGECNQRAWAMWYGESRTALPAYGTMDPRERRTVRLTSVYGTCSGVIVHPSYVLTNAHCVGYPWNGQTREDCALLELDAPFDANGYMLLSNESNSTLQAYPSINTGYPSYTNGAACQSGTGRVFTQHGASSTVTAHITGRGTVKTTLDASTGQSGSPIYSCPAGDPQTCTGGQSGTVYGLVSRSERNANDDVVDVRGPRIPGRLRSWALGILP